MTKEAYLNNKTFCMLPWTHLHMWPNGETYPCCLADSRMPIGSSHDNTIQELWNNDKMRAIRNNMLEGRESCLLYTSPSPRDKRQSRMPSSA